MSAGQGTGVCAERQALARNMSAPPRTTLTFSALAPQTGASGDAVADGAGLSLVCRLDFGSLLPKCYERTIARDGSLEVRGPDDYVRVAYAYARAEKDERKRPTRATYSHARVATVEALADELRDLAAAVSLSAAGLPPFGMLLPTHNVARVAEASLCRTIAILSRRRGSVFLRDADPIVWSALDWRALDLWAPVAAPGRPA